jgi:hypothetical protein
MSVRNGDKDRRENAEEIGMEQVMSWFANHLMSYFGDDGDDDAIIARLREQFPHYPIVERNFRLGLDALLAIPAWDRARFVGQFANRSADSDEEARAWPVSLRDKLFAP